MTVKRKKKKGKNRSWAKKQTYDGIEFQSGLEVYCYKALKKSELEFLYEKVTYTVIEGFIPTVPVWSSYRKIFKSRATPVRPVTYTPDFVATDQSWVIETKGWKSEGFKFRWKLFLRYIMRRDLKTEVFMPTSREEIDITVKHLKKTYGS